MVCLILAADKPYHKTCFTCGGVNGDGCKRKLDLATYQARNGHPYCNVCFTRLAGNDAAKVTNVSAIARDTTAVEDDRPHVSIAERTRAFSKVGAPPKGTTPTGGSSPTKAATAAAAAPLVADHFEQSEEEGGREPAPVGADQHSNEEIPPTEDTPTPSADVLVDAPTPEEVDLDDQIAKETARIHEAAQQLEDQYAVEALVVERASVTTETEAAEATEASE